MPKPTTHTESAFGMLTTGTYAAFVPVQARADRAYRLVMQAPEARQLRR